MSKMLPFPVLVFFYFSKDVNLKYTQIAPSPYPSPEVILHRIYWSNSAQISNEAGFLESSIDEKQKGKNSFLCWIKRFINSSLKPGSIYGIKTLQKDVCYKPGISKIQSAANLAHPLVLWIKFYWNSAIFTTHLFSMAVSCFNSRDEFSQQSQYDPQSWKYLLCNSLRNSL